MNGREANRPSLGALQSIFGGTLRAITFSVEVKGSGTAGTAPEIDPILLCAGFDKTIVPATSVVYQTTSDESLHKTATIYYYESETVHKLVGCVCESFSYEASAGGLMMLSVTMVGKISEVVDAVPPAPTYINIQPAPFLNAGFTVGAYAAAVIESLSFDMGLEISKSPDVNQTDGFAIPLLVNRKPTGSFEPDATSIATKDFIGEFEAGTSSAVSTDAIGPVGNQVKLNLGEISYTDVGQGERSGRRTRTLPFEIVDQTVTDNDVKFTFT
jgi:hypothetical protein